MERTPLEPEALSEAARRALQGAGPLKMMAARGLAPLPRPVDLASVLYQLALESDATIKAAAEKTAGEVPEKILLGALSDPALDPRVLDFFAGRVIGKPALIDAVLLNRNTADDTVLALAPRLGEREVEIVVTNEQRLLRAPAIIGAIYMNPRARMSTVDRAVELAVRNQITVEGIPSWDTVVAAVLGTQASPAASEEVDQAFAAATVLGVGDGTQQAAAATPLDAADAAQAEDENAGQDLVADAKEKLQLSKLTIPAKIRLATLGNAFARSVLVRDSNKVVALAAIRSPGVTDNEVVKFSSNRGLSDEVVRVIAGNKEWTRLYQVKVNLVNNPKTPLQQAMRFLPFLHDKDLKNVARSKGVSSALVAQAKKLVSAKTGGKP